MDSEVSQTDEKGLKVPIQNENKNESVLILPNISSGKSLPFNMKVSIIDDSDLVVNMLNGA